MAEPVNHGNYKYDVFVSHSSLDKIEAYQVCLFLETKGLKCWLADRNNEDEAGESYQEFILEAIEASKIMVVLLSNNAKASKYVGIEIERGYHYDRPIIPFKIAELSLDRKLEFYFSSIQILDGTKGNVSDHLQKLTENCLKALLRINRSLESRETIISENGKLNNNEEDKVSKQFSPPPTSHSWEFQLDKVLVRQSKNDDNKASKQEISKLPSNPPISDSSDSVNRNAPPKLSSRTPEHFTFIAKWGFAMIFCILLLVVTVVYLRKNADVDIAKGKQTNPERISVGLIPKKVKFRFPISKYDDTAKYKMVSQNDSVFIGGKLFSVKVVQERTQASNLRIKADANSNEGERKNFILNIVFFKNDTLNTMITKKLEGYMDDEPSATFFKIQKNPNSNAGNLYLNFGDFLQNNKIHYVRFDGKRVHLDYITILGGMPLQGVFSKDEKTLLTITYCDYQYKQYPTRSKCVVQKFQLKGDSYVSSPYEVTASSYSLSGKLSEILVQIQKREPNKFPNGVDLSKMNFSLNETFLLENGVLK